MKLLQESTIFKQKHNHEISCNFCMKFFTPPSSKNTIATLRIVIKEKSELTFTTLTPLSSTQYKHSSIFLYTPQY